MTPVARCKKLRSGPFLFSFILVLVVTQLKTELWSSRMKIKKLPDVLGLHLKRFKYQEDLGRYIKLSYRVVFPFQLRLPNTSDDSDNPDRLYELFAFVVHVGG